MNKMTKKIFIIIIVVLIVGLISLLVINHFRKDNLEKDDHKKETINFKASDWQRLTESDTEFLYFNEDGTFSYYCACGSPVDDFDACEKYTYDKNKNQIVLKCMDGKRKLKIVEYNEDKLVLEFEDGNRTFIPEEEPANDIEEDEEYEQ